MLNFFNIKRVRNWMFIASIIMNVVPAQCSNWNLIVFSDSLAKHCVRNTDGGDVVQADFNLRIKNSFARMNLPVGSFLVRQGMDPKGQGIDINVRQDEFVVVRFFKLMTGCVYIPKIYQKSHFCICNFSNRFLGLTIRRPDKTVREPLEPHLLKVFPIGEKGCSVKINSTEDNSGVLLKFMNDEQRDTTLIFCMSGSFSPGKPGFSGETVAVPFSRYSVMDRHAQK